MLKEKLNDHKYIISPLNSTDNTPTHPHDGCDWLKTNHMKQLLTLDLSLVN